MNKRKINSWAIKDDHVVVNWRFDGNENTIHSIILTDNILDCDASVGGKWLVCDKPTYEKGKFARYTKQRIFVSTEDLVNESLLTQYLNR